MGRLTKVKRQELIAKLKGGDADPSELAEEFGITRQSVLRLRSTLRKEEEESEDSASDDTQSQVSEADGGIAEEFHNNVSAFAKDLGLSDEVSVPEEDDDKDSQLSAMKKALREKLTGNRDDDDDDYEMPTRPQLNRPIPQAVMSRYSDLHDSGIDRASVMQKIAFNIQYFAPLISQITGSDTKQFLQSLVQKGDRELQSLLDLIERTRSVGNLTNTFRHTFYAVAQGTEVVSQMFIGMKTQGFTQALSAQDSEITMCLREIAIDRYDQFKGANKPEYRLGLMFVQTLLVLDQKNRSVEALNRSEPMTPENSARFADL